jgi:hypothetical protein
MRRLPRIAGRFEATLARTQKVEGGSIILNGWRAVIEPPDRRGRRRGLRQAHHGQLNGKLSKRGSQGASLWQRAGPRNPPVLQCRRRAMVRADAHAAVVVKNPGGKATGSPQCQLYRGMIATMGNKLSGSVAVCLFREHWFPSSAAITAERRAVR